MVHVSEGQRSRCCVNGCVCGFATEASTHKFVLLALDVRNRFPRATLVCTPVGNLAIMHGDRFIGHIDLLNFSIELLEDHPDTP